MNCSKCGKDVGCGCNLVNGACLNCYGKEVERNPDFRKTTSKVKQHKQPPSSPEPNNEFVNILRTQGISKEEKLKRINKILEDAIKKANDNS